MDYPCAKSGLSGDCTFIPFGFIVRTDTQTDRHAESHTDAANRYTHATTVGVSNNETYVREPPYVMLLLQ